MATGYTDRSQDAGQAPATVASKQHDCDHATAPAGAIEEQIAEFVADFRPSANDPDEILRRRRQLKERRTRLRDLYELSDLERAAYAA